MAGPRYRRVVSVTVDADPTPPAERYGWTFRLLGVVAWLVVLGCLLWAVIAVVDLVTWTQPGARVPVTLTGQYELRGPSGTNSYSGSAFIADGTRVVATEVQAEVEDVPRLTAAVLALAPLIQAITAGWIALLATGVMRTSRPV